MNNAANLFEMAKSHSLDSLEHFLNKMSAWTCEDHDQALVYPWMCLASLSSSEFVFHYKILFRPKDLHLVVAKVLGGEREMIGDTEVFDFVKELVNLQVGAFKSSIETSGLTCDVSLPVVMNGFENYFFKDRDNLQHDTWSLKNGRSSFVTEVSLEILDEVAFENRRFFNSLPITGKIDFL